ncbi:class I SAM-dependent methyltransferase (plasmid) [Ureibacillus chungkukjangi]|uniref:class I SAM-dependent methyltransferase n=1 Tax=Ureibacillus chungkukjangi TaxID=1202712 RepID=UPI00187D1E6F|nr:class I SAM-dependent methyltransferase [Ureibacillus chungkukjangi]MCM3390618.1 class I SAM-dependent methyltransferase [Ureibacillus chungkukjangi]HCG4536273.1 class I SAM-dependent methyltransferase [Salmonella enterica subsp. enterica serovar Typhi str. AG3]
MELEKYDIFANFYDILIPEPPGLIDFYLEMAKPYQNILDAGCGTGTLALELAKEEKHILGLDISSDMIDKACKKAKDCGLENIVKFDTGDIKNLNLKQKFDLIILSGGVFEFLLSIKDQVKTLMTLRSLLNNNGKLVFDVIVPPTVCPFEDRKSDVAKLPHNILGEGTHIYSWHECKFKHFHQLVYTNLFIEIYGLEKKLVDKYNFNFMTRYTTPSEMMHLLSRCGYKIESKYGDFYKSPLKEDSEFMIYVVSPVS